MRRAETAATLILEANGVVQGDVVAHERDDEGNVYPTLPRCSPAATGSRP